MHVALVLDKHMNDVISTFARSPHERGAAFVVGPVLHGGVDEEDIDRLREVVLGGVVERRGAVRVGTHEVGVAGEQSAHDGRVTCSRRTTFTCTPRYFKDTSCK